MENKSFHWEQIGDLTLGRPHLGKKTDVAIYRLMQYTMRSVLEARLGEEAAQQLFYEAGQLAGTAYFQEFLAVPMLPEEFLAALRRQMIADSIGILQVESCDWQAQQLVVTVAEDLDCSGLPVKGVTVCEYDEGFIAGIMKAYTGHEFIVREIDCWATGDRTCRFDIRLQEEPL